MLALKNDSGPASKASRIPIWSIASAIVFSLLPGCVREPPEVEAAEEGIVEIEWWHAMGGALGEVIDIIASGFNESQTRFRINPIFRGGYNETMNGAVAAYRAGEQPHFVQVFEVGTATMFAAEGAVYPVWELMRDMQIPLQPEGYLPAVLAYYADAQGRLVSMPFNSSTPVLYYNRTLSRKPGWIPGFLPLPGRNWNNTQGSSLPRGSPADSRPPGNRGFRSRISTPGITFHSQPFPMGSTVSILSC